MKSTTSLLHSHSIWTQSAHNSKTFSVISTTSWSNWLIRLLRVNQSPWSSSSAPEPKSWAAFSTGFSPLATVLVTNTYRLMSLSYPQHPYNQWTQRQSASSTSSQLYLLQLPPLTLQRSVMTSECSSLKAFRPKPTQPLLTYKLPDLHERSLTKLSDVFSLTSRMINLHNNTLL